MDINTLELEEKINMVGQYFTEKEMSYFQQIQDTYNYSRQVYLDWLKLFADRKCEASAVYKVFENLKFNEMTVYSEFKRLNVAFVKDILIYTNYCYNVNLVDYMKLMTSELNDRISELHFTDILIPYLNTIGDKQLKEQATADMHFEVGSFVKPAPASSNALINMEYRGTEIAFNFHVCGVKDGEPYLKWDRIAAVLKAAEYYNTGIVNSIEKLATMYAEQIETNIGVFVPLKNTGAVKSVKVNNSGSVILRFVAQQYSLEFFKEYSLLSKTQVDTYNQYLRNKYRININEYYNPREPKVFTKEVNGEIETLTIPYWEYSLGHKEATKKITEFLGHDEENDSEEEENFEDECEEEYDEECDEEYEEEYDEEYDD